LLLLVLLLSKANVGDIMYAMLGGAIVGLVAGTFALAKGIRADRAVLLAFAGILGGAAAWLFASVVLRITTVNLYSITALAFDLIVGLIGAVSLCFFLIDRYQVDPIQSHAVQGESE
jgi:hypothetical protein